MPKAYAHIPMPRRAIDFAQSRISELDDEIGRLEQERVMWKGLLKILRPCKACNGQGELRHQVAHDESRGEKCQKCEGTGTDQS